MADVPSEAPHKVAGSVAGGAANAAKRIPKPMWIFIIGGIVLFVLYRRHQQSQQAQQQSGQNASATAAQAANDPNAIDPATGLPYGQENAPGSGLDQAYLSGYDSGIYSNMGGVPTDIFGGVNSGAAGSLPSGSGGTTTQNPIDGPINITNNIPTGGGPPTRPNVHGRMSTLPSDAPAGAIAAPFQHRKPQAPPGFMTVGTGSGNWMFVPLTSPVHAKPKPKKVKHKIPSGDLGGDK